MSDSVRPHRQQPTRLLCPWDSPGKNTGVGCHFLLQCMKVKSESEVAQSCLTLHYPMDCSLPGSSAHGIFQARVLEWVAIAFSNGYTRVPKIYTSLTFVPLCSCRTLSSCKVPFRYFWESPGSISPHDQAPVSCLGLLPGDTHHSFLHFLLLTPTGTKVPHWAPLLLLLDTIVFTSH